MSLGMSASVARNAAEGEARLPVRVLMVCTVLLLYIELGESLYNGVPKGLVIVSLICRGVSEPLTANPKLLSPSEASSLR